MPSRHAAVPRWRINVLLLVVIVASLVMSCQLVVVQVLGEHRGRALNELVQDELTQHVVLQPRRGTISDRNGVALAMNVNKPSLYVDPSQVTNPQKLAAMLGPLISANPADLVPILSNTERYWDRLKPWLEPATAEQVDAIAWQDVCATPCLHLVNEAKREYPQGAFASRVVGVSNHAGEGVTGVELFYDSYIRGITGTLETERGADQNPILIAPQEVVEPQNGKDVKLTIDSAIQKMVEDELDRIIVERKPKSATLMVMDPNTGEVLAMGSRKAGVTPFDPNNYAAYDLNEINSNDALRNVYEPGSTMKSIVTAIGLQTGAFTTTTTVNDTGTIMRDGNFISNYNFRHNGVITPAQMLYYSSNVGALQFSEMIGADPFYNYLKLFGYGQLTGIDLGAEEIGIVHTPGDGTWSPIYLDTNSYGHGIGVTPIQHLNAYGVLANGGVLMRPYVVKEICDGDQCTATEPYQVRRVLDQSVTDQLRPMLGRNSEHYGAGMWSQFTGTITDQPLVPGYRTAAKTGTSQIPDEDGVYHANIVVASVAGWVPLENPRVTILVRVDEPEGGVNGTGIYGSDAAIPSFQRLVTQIMRYYRISPDLSYIAPEQELGGPPLPVLTPAPAPTPVPTPAQGVLPVPSDPVMLPTPTARVQTP